MRRALLLLLVVGAAASTTSFAHAGGLLIPTEPDLPPLAMLNHHVSVTLEDQAAVTKVMQTFRNHTDRRLEATYIFPVPQGAVVRNFAMWVNGQRVKGELLEAKQAKDIYASVVRQTKNPALLDYMGSNLLRLRIFPIPPKGDQKVEVSFTAIAKKEHELVEYLYPLKTDRNAASTLEEFRLKVSLKSQQPIGAVYSPTHEVTVNQHGDHQAIVTFEKQGAALDRDFQLFYTSSGQDIGVTALQHRPLSDEDGYVMLLVSPRAELSQTQKVPRDIVFVVDTSGSMMHDKKIDKARKALQHCLSGLSSDDRFALVSFATTVERYRNKLAPVNDEQIKKAKGWVADLYAGGGTAIHEALTTALEMRQDDNGRMFTIVFFTDGQPTIGETKIEKILADVSKKNSENTRIFSFGLGDDLNAVFLDQIAEQTHAVSSYVRPEQDIEAKVSHFFNKIRHPVLAGLKLSTTGDVRLAEVYPPKLPDLFHGDQLVVLARYEGSGHAAVVLDGQVGPHEKRFVYELDFQKRTEEKPFVEQLWARRKVGYLLDQIRRNGEQAELVQAVVELAKNYGITTPYTSYLIMPDAPLQLASASPRDGKTDGALGRLNRLGGAPPALESGGLGGMGGGLSGTPGKNRVGGKQRKVVDFARRVQRVEGELAENRGRFQDQAFKRLDADMNSALSQSSRLAREAKRAGGAGRGQTVNQPANASSTPALPTANEALRQFAQAKRTKEALDKAHANYRQGNWKDNQIRKLGVDLAVCTNDLKCQSQLSATAVRRVAKRNCMEIGGVWIDEAFTAKTRTVAIKAQSDAYFQILAKKPDMKEVFQLGNHIVWITPSGVGLVIDTTDGKDRITNREIDTLFAKR